MLIFGSLLLVAFVIIELKQKERKSPPVLDPKLFRIKEFAGGTVAQMINAVAWSGVIVMVSFYLQVVAAYSPLQTGLHLLALDAGFIVIGPIAGKLSDIYGSRIFVMTGLSVSSIAFLLFAFVNSTTGVTTILIALGVLGIGSGLWVSPNISSVMGSVPPNRRGVASAFRMTLSNVGDTASFGLAILIMTFAIPYNTLNKLVQNYSYQTTILPLSKQEFILGFQLVAFVLAAVNTIAILPASFTKKKVSRVTEIVE
jgi:MFS family permease